MSSSSGPKFSAITMGRTEAVLDRAIAESRDLVLDIDVQGARQLKEAIPDAVSIFILAPSREILEQRLKSRSEDDEAVIQKRLRKAAEEIRNYTSYDYVLVNDDLARSTRDTGGDRGSRARPPDPSGAGGPVDSGQFRIERFRSR